MGNRLLALLLALILCAGFCVFGAGAQEEEVPSVELKSYDGDAIYPSVVVAQEDDGVPMPMADVAYHATVEEAAADMRAQLIAGVSPVSVGLSCPYSSELVNQIYNLAFLHTGDPKEGDYLNNRVRGAESQVQYGSDGFLMILMPNYATTATQEAQVDAQVDQILKSIRRDTAYHAVVDIFHWLRENVSYQGGDIIQHTAYGALVGGSGVCESYAGAFYRLALECGVDCRIVSGLLIDGGHAWNIVELDGEYYILDATNDIFLRCEASVAGLLVPESLYDGGAYPGSYSISSRDYVADIPYSYDAAANHLTLSETAVRDYHRDVTELLMEQQLGATIPEDYVYSVAPWESLTGEVEIVTITGKPTFIPGRMFEGRRWLREITIPGSVTAVGDWAFISCFSLETVYFQGTQAQWDAMTLGDYGYFLTDANVVFQPPADTFTGLRKAEDGEYYYYIDGVVQESYTGLMANSAGRWYILNGHAELSYDGLIEFEGTKYLIKAGRVNTAFTGITKQEGVYYYFAEGVNDLEFEGLVYCNGMKAYVQNGEVNFNKSGVVEDEGNLVYVKYGIWRNTFKGLARADDGNWLYFVNGTFDATYTGVAKLNANWVYVENGYVNFNYSGIITVGTYDYTVKYGVVQF